MSNRIKLNLGGFMKVAEIASGSNGWKVAENANIAKTSYSVLKKNSSCNTTTLKRIIEAMGEDFIIVFKGVEYQIVDKK